MKKGPQSIGSEFMILGHSLQSHGANMIYFHLCESLSMETCTILDIAGVLSVKVFPLSVWH